MIHGIVSSQNLDALPFPRQDIYAAMKRFTSNLATRQNYANTNGGTIDFTIFSQDRNWLVVAINSGGAGNQTFVLYNIEETQQLVGSPITQPPSNLKDLAMNSTNSYIAYATTSSPYITVVNAATRINTISFASVSDAGMAVDFNSLGSTLYIAFGDNDNDPSDVSYVHARAIPSGTELDSSNSLAMGSVLSMKVNPANTRVAVGGLTNGSYPLLVLDAADLTTVLGPTLGNQPNASVQYLTWSPDGNWLAMCLGGGTLLAVYNTSTWAQVSLTAPTEAFNTVIACAFSTDGESLIFVGYGSGVVTYRVGTWTISYQTDDSTFTDTLLGDEESDGAIRIFSGEEL